jgi:hypothetical protein
MGLTSIVICDACGKTESVEERYTAHLLSVRGGHYEDPAPFIDHLDVGRFIGAGFSHMGDKQTMGLELCSSCAEQAFTAIARCLPGLKDVVHKKFLDYFVGVEDGK